MKIVLNASPAIFLAKIDLINSLPLFCDQLIIPEGVINEIQKQHDETSQWLKQNEGSYQVSTVKVPAYIHAWDLGKDGKSYREALDNVQVIIEQWLDKTNSIGKTIPNPKGRLMFA